MDYNANYPYLLDIEQTGIEKIVTQKVIEKAKGVENQLTYPDYNKESVEFSDKSEPHHDFQYLRKISSSVLDLIGSTPLVRLDRFAKKYGIECELLGKCEFFNPGGSLKDRIAQQMVMEAEEQGVIQSGHTLIEGTSGNTGIGLSLVGAVKGYHVVITMPEKMSQEKYCCVQALGAEIVRTPTEAAWNEVDSHISRAYQLNSVIPKSCVLDQYKNPGNPRAHYHGTAEEILYQCDYRIDVVIVTAGTGGAITGIAKKIKEKLPNCQIVGVDPYGSILAEPSHLNEYKLGQSYMVEGIGYDFIPSSLHRQYVDTWIKSDDKESFRVAREFIKLEGLLIGGTSGSALIGVLKYAKTLKKGQRCVVLLPDSCRNYMTKMMSNEWMVDNGFYDKPYPKSTTDLYPQDVGSLIKMKSPPKKIVADLTWGEALEIGKSVGEEHLAVMHHDGSDTLLGVLPLRAFLKCITNGFDKTTLITSYIEKKFPVIYTTNTVYEAAEKLQLHSYCVVYDKESKLQGILTPLNVVQ